MSAARSMPAVRLPEGLIRQRTEHERLGEVRGRVRTELQARGRENQPEAAPERERPEIVQTRAEVLAETQLRANTSAAQRLLTKRLAQIDKMRDTALENGNERMLEQADRLEQLARWQFENRFAARANNPFAEVEADTTTEGSAQPTLHPFRPVRMPAPEVNVPALPTEADVTTEATATTETTTTTTIEP